MKKKFIYAAAFVFFFLAAGLYTPHEASAVPAFARQTGMACNSCHFQHFPTLNVFGRSFKAGGYTMIGGQSMVEGDFLSIPAVLNASLTTKIRYQKRSGDNTDPAATSDDIDLNKGQIQFPDEAAIHLGGRAGEHIGFLLEASLKDSNTSATMFTSYKTVFVFDAADTKINIIPFTTDGLGASYGLELLNTGAVRHIRPLEHRTQTSAQQYIGTDGAATGLTFGAVHSMGFANYTMWYPVKGDAAAGPLLHYARAAFTPTVAGWDLGFGGQWWGGTDKRGDGAGAVREHADAWALDAQAQGTAGNFPLGVYLTYARAKKSKTAIDTETNIFNSSTAKDKSAWTATAELGVIPNRLTVSAAWRGGKSGAAGNDTDNAATLGLNYNPTQNLEVQLNNSWFSGEGGPNSAEGDMLTTVMIFAAF